MKITQAISIFIFLPFLPLHLSFAAPAEILSTFESKAFKENGQLAYTARHQVWRKDEKVTRIEIQYFKPDQKQFAHSVAQFKQHPYLPEFQFFDRRTGKEEGLELDNDKVHLTYKRDQHHEKKKESFTPDSQTLVIQGFLPFLDQNAQSLATGKEQSIKLLLPSRLASYQFQIKGQQVKGQPHLAKIQVIVSNFILRMFVKKIVMTYDTKNKQLVSYEGITVIRRDEGGNEDYRITYGNYQSKMIESGKEVKNPSR